MASFIPGKEFVPGVGLQSMGSKGDLSAIPLEKVSSDLKVTKEWVPPSQRQPSEKSHVLQAAPSTPTASRQGYSASGGGGGGDYDHQWGYDEGEDGNGGAYGGYDTASAEVDEDLGLLWGDNSSTLPAPPRRTLQTLGIPDPIRQHFQDLDHATLRQMEPSDERYKEMPNRFHSAFALDDVYAQTKRGTGGSYGYPTAVYKAVDRSDSQVYALRRVDNVRITPSTSTIAKAVMGRWCDMRHPAICTLYSISPERGGLFFLHAYHPAAQTLRQRFIDLRGALLAESLMWRLLVQLVSGVHYAHVRGIPVRNISISHVLLTSSTMARISGVGIVDVLEADSRKNASDLMQEDMVKLGYTLLSLASRTSCTSKNAEQAAQILQKSYSHDLYSAINVLLQGKTNTTQFIRAISEKVQDELDSSFAATDALHSHLRSEYENGRMMRLMLKLNLVTERPEFASAPQWSETGDRYVLKLFRDYVYHQNNEDGKPVLDAGHMISALNKLDCGDSEQILLSSRNNKDLLVVSFADVRRCLESAVDELTHMSAHGQGQGQGQGQSYGTSHQQHHGQYQYMLSQQMQQQQQQQQGYQQYTGGYMQHGSGGGGRGGGIDPRQRGSGRGGY